MTDAALAIKKVFDDFRSACEDDDDLYRLQQGEELDAVAQAVRNPQACNYVAQALMKMLGIDLGPLGARADMDKRFPEMWDHWEALQDGGDVAVIFGDVEVNGVVATAHNFVLLAWKDGDTVFYSTMMAYQENYSIMDCVRFEHYAPKEVDAFHPQIMVARASDPMTLTGDEVSLFYRSEFKKEGLDVVSGQRYRARKDLRCVGYLPRDALVANIEAQTPRVLRQR